jgi:hypothetical protein
MSTIRRFIFGTLLALWATGCATSQQRSQIAMDTNANQSIEFLYFDGCPNTPQLRVYLEAALDQSNGSFTAIDLTKLPETDIRRGYGSPTILVNGRDLFDMPQPATPTMSCRIYPGGVPDTDTLIAKLSEITP